MYNYVSKRNCSMKSEKCDHEIKVLVNGMNPEETKGARSTCVSNQLIT